MSLKISNNMQPLSQQACTNAKQEPHKVKNNSDSEFIQLLSLYWFSYAFHKHQFFSFYSHWEYGHI